MVSVSITNLARMRRETIQAVRNLKIDEIDFLLKLVLLLTRKAAPAFDQLLKKIKAISFCTAI